MTITDQDMHYQVRTALAGHTPDFDVKGIVNEIIRHRGLCDINSLSPDFFWYIVRGYDISAGHDSSAAASPADPGMPLVYAPDSPKAAEPYTVPAAGPVWTNGQAAAADAGHPAWCEQLHPRVDPSGVVRHRLEILTMVVQDVDITDDVPLTVAMERTDDPQDGPGATRTVLAIGHALYQPTEVSLSPSDRARLAAALLTAQGLEVVDGTR